MGEFEDKVRRYWPSGDPLNQASQFLRSEQIDVALQLCRMYLVDKVAMDDAQDKRVSAMRRMEQQLAKTQAALESSLAMQQEDEQTIGEARALLEQAAEMCGDARWTTVNAETFLILAEQIRAFLAAHPAPERGLEGDDDE